MIVQSFKLKLPEPGPRLRQYASYFDRSDAQELASMYSNRGSLTTRSRTRPSRHMKPPRIRD